MIIGVPKEVKDHETRVGLVPSGVTALREAGHEVLVQSTAGAGSALTDSEYIEAGAVILPPMPGFYHLPKTVEDIVDLTVVKILDQFSLHLDLIKRWNGLPAGEA